MIPASRKITPDTVAKSSGSPNSTDALQLITLFRRLQHGRPWQHQAAGDQAQTEPEGLRLATRGQITGSG
jgi:hypothetical protein